MTSLSLIQALEKMVFSKSHVQEVALLNHNVPVFLPWEGYIQSQVVPAMLLSALFLTIVHIISYILLGSAVAVGQEQQRQEGEGSSVGGKNNNSSSNGNSSSSSSSDITIIMLTPQQRHLISYRITNFVANTCLCMLGLYYWTLLPPLLPPHNTVANGNEYYLLGSFQLGYQLWALPVGHYLVHETPVMMLHHVSVILVSIMSTMFTNGFRYWTPYFYGIFEISSIPLAIMNAFKDHKDWRDAYPSLYLLIRAIFAVSFLGVRVIHCSPRHVAFLIEHYYLWSSSSSSQNAVYIVYMAIVWICSAFLLLLNLYWGIIIVKGLVKTVEKMIFPKSNKQKTK